MNLMQNCDLPPPMKVFMGSDNKTVVSSMNMELDDDAEKLELLKALRLSQTRAREAEKKAEILAKERDFLSMALLEEARQLFAHRLWVRLLELQVSSLKRSEMENDQILKGDHEDGGDDEDHDHDHGVCVNWAMALAFCFSIAGFAFCYRCLF